MRTDVPKAWEKDPEGWWEHVANCPDCKLFFLHAEGVTTETGFGLGAPLNDGQETPDA